MATPRETYIAFHRFGYGARPGDAKIIATDPRGAVLAEIADPKAALITDPSLPSASDALLAGEKSRQLAQAYRRKQIAADLAEARRTGKPAEPDMAGRDMAMMAPDANARMGGDMMGGEMMGGDMAGPKGAGLVKGKDGALFKRPKVPDNPEYRYIVHTYQTEVETRLERACDMRIGYPERLVAFWSNHFAVDHKKSSRLRAIVGAYDREAIRPHVLGRFRDMLGAVMKHPAMLLYLDNFQSVGPKSQYGIASGEGLNENLARESLELHTVGVDGGYTQSDVTSYAKVLTGWTVIPPKAKENPGVFVFSALRHEPGDQTVLGRLYAAGGREQGEAVLDELARHPATANHVARKLVTAFVADKPPQDLVDRLAKVFLDTDGDLGEVSRALARDDAAWAAPSSKLRLPSEYLFASARALDLDLEGAYVARTLQTFGEQPWNPVSPQGFSIRSTDWLAPDALTNRLDLAQIFADRADPQIDARSMADDIFGGTVSRDTAQAVSRAESAQQAIALLLMSPEFQRR